jgi:catechol 2,3-dioxygenase-like lactoylglutathione lyase family enzyme
MYDHIGLRTRHFKATEAFYFKLLPTLGIARIAKYPDAAGFSDGGKETFWIGASKKAPSSVHLAFGARTRAEVDKFYKKALQLGAKDNGPPGLRPDYGPNYYAAFILDPDGNNVEAVCHRRK